MLNAALFSITLWLLLVVVTHQNPISPTSDVADDTSKECQSKPDGTYPVRNLTEYLVCKNYSGSFHTCFNNELYSPANQSCLPLKFMNEATFCKDRSTGDWANPWDCTKYFHCYYNWYEIHSCEIGKIYDAVADVCLHPALKGNDSLCKMPNITSLPELSNTTSNHTETSPDGITSGSSESINNTEISTILNGTMAANSSQTNDTSNDLISIEDVQRKLTSNDSNAIILIDVRMPWELKAVGKIGRSINIPLPDIEVAFQMENDAFKTKYGINKPEKDDCNLVFHCKSGFRSQRAVDAVKELGYTCPKSMDGGFTAWKEIYQK